MLLIDWISKVVGTDVFLGTVLKTKIFFSLVYTQKFMFSEKDTNIWSYFPSKELSKLSGRQVQIWVSFSENLNFTN